MLGRCWVLQNVLGLLHDCVPNNDVADACFPLVSLLVKLGMALWPTITLEPARRSCLNKPYIANEAAEKLAQVRPVIPCW